MNVLDIPGWKHIGTEKEGRDLILRAEYTEPPQACLGCGIANEPGKLYRWSAKEQDFRDTPMQGKRCTLRVNRQRWRCRECGRTFFQPLAGIDEGHRMTERLVDYIRDSALERTYASLAVELGLDESTVRAVFNEYAEKLRDLFRVETPIYLGMDELHVLKHPRAVFTDLFQHTIIDMLEKRDKKTILNYLSRMPDRERVELVCMDMWLPYKEAVKVCLPQAAIIIDKYHVVRMAQDSLEKVRKEIRRDLTPGQRKLLMHERFVLWKRRRNLKPSDMLKLDEWTGAFPRLMAAYEAKETFYELFDSDLSSQEAKTRYEEWLAGLDDSTRLAFSDLIRAIKNWEPEVFAYFDHRITNAFTEAINGITRVVNRMGRGYSFDALRVKMLFRSPRKIRRKKAKPPVAPASDRVSEPSTPYPEGFSVVVLTHEDADHIDLQDLGVYIEGLEEFWSSHDFNTETLGEEPSDSTQKTG